MLRRDRELTPVELHKKIREAVHKELNKVKAVPTDAVGDKYTILTGEGTYINDKNDREVHVFSPNNVLNCV